MEKNSLTNSRRASEIIGEILLEIAPDRAALLQAIVDIEEVHLSDRATASVPLVNAIIEKAAKAAEPAVET